MAHVNIEQCKSQQGNNFNDWVMYHYIIWITQNWHQFKWMHSACCRVI